MSFGERDAFTSLLTTLIVAVMFYLNISGQFAAGAYDGPEALQLWARSVLWLVAYSIGIAIVIAILFAILYAMLTGEKKLSDLRDERDRMIEIRGMRIGMILISIGLMAAIVDLALGASALHALIILLISCSVSEIVKNIFKIACYRRGF